MGIHLVDLYRSPNIGVFMKANEKFVLMPKGAASSKASHIAEYLEAEVVPVSVGGSRLLGPLICMNSHGILVSPLAEEDEVADLRRRTDIPVERITTKYTAIGNLVAANDKGAVVSRLLSRPAIDLIADVLNVPVAVTDLASYVQVGSMIFATNTGGIVHPKASDEEIQTVKEALNVGIEAGTVNGGVPIVASGLVANARNAIVGSLTTGPELMILSRALSV